jgi:hypothetical protein
MLANYGIMPSSSIPTSSAGIRSATTAKANKDTAAFKSVPSTVINKDKANKDTAALKSAPSTVINKDKTNKDTSSLKSVPSTVVNKGKASEDGTVVVSKLADEASVAPSLVKAVKFRLARMSDADAEVFRRLLMGVLDADAQGRMAPGGSVPVSHHFYPILHTSINSVPSVIT